MTYVRDQRTKILHNCQRAAAQQSDVFMQPYVQRFLGEVHRTVATVRGRYHIQIDVKRYLQLNNIDEESARHFLI